MSIYFKFLSSIILIFLMSGCGGYQVVSPDKIIYTPKVADKDQTTTLILKRDIALNGYEFNAYVYIDGLHTVTLSSGDVVELKLDPKDYTLGIVTKHMVNGEYNAERLISLEKGKTYTYVLYFGGINIIALTEDEIKLASSYNQDTKQNAEQIADSIDRGIKMHNDLKLYRQSVNEIIKYRRQGF